jgi:hypothetical protein
VAELSWANAEAHSQAMNSRGKRILFIGTSCVSSFFGRQLDDIPAHRVGRFLYAVLRLDACVTDFTKGRWTAFCTGKGAPVAEGKKKVSE